MTEHDTEHTNISVAAAANETALEPLFTAEQARVVAVLVEKSITTPKYYPMTVNAITQGCNQKTSRSPVMAMTEGEVGHALLQLAEMNFVTRDDSSARATKWSQRFKQELELDPQTRSVLVACMLRGPQTRGELRTHAEPMNGPKTSEALDDAVLQLLTRPQPLFIEFERQAGQKEARVMHTVCGQPDEPEPAENVTASSSLSALEQRVAVLETQLKTLLAER